MAGLCESCMTREARSPHDLLCDDCERKRTRTLQAALAVALAETEAARTPLPDAYPCQRCGRRDGMDAVATPLLWSQLVDGRILGPRGEVGDGKWNILCLWCMDELAYAKGLGGSVSLHFVGRALTAGSQSDADLDHVSRLVEQRDAAERRAAGLAGKIQALIGNTEAMQGPWESLVDNESDPLPDDFDQDTTYKAFARGWECALVAVDDVFSAATAPDRARMGEIMSDPRVVRSGSDDEVLFVLDSRAAIYCLKHGYHSRFVWNGTRVVVECCERALAAQATGEGAKE